LSLWSPLSLEDAATAFSDTSDEAIEEDELSSDDDADDSEDALEFSISETSEVIAE
jgi:hypothetical protein